MRTHDSRLSRPEDPTKRGTAGEHHTPNRPDPQADANEAGYLPEH